MNGRVIFFPLKHCLSEEKLKELEALQDQLYYSRVSFLNTIKRESGYQQALAHIKFRSLVKDRLKVISTSDCEAHC